MRNKLDTVNLAKVLILATVILAACGNGNKGQKEVPTAEKKLDGGVKTEQVEEAPLTGALLEGKKVYDQYCLSCHQSKGTGVPNLNPPLKKTEYVTGDKSRLIGIVLNGSNEGLNVNGMSYSNAMPPHSFLSDKEIANVLSYIRNSFGNKADTVSESEVKAVRETLK